MLKDTTNGNTYSSRTDAIRTLGNLQFAKKVKNNELKYIQVG